MSEEIQVMQNDESGKVIFADEVVAIISGIAAAEVEGVAAMSANLVGNVAEKLGRKNLAKGVKVEVGEKQARVSAYIIVEYGFLIPDVASGVQESVKKAIETMTGLEVVSVDVYVQGINFEREKERAIPEVTSQTLL